MIRLRSAPIVTLTLLALVACRDAPVAPTAPTVDANTLGAIHSGDDGSGSEGRGDFQRYVAIGTSVSMGWRSDGVWSEFQKSSWPAQLAGLAHRQMSVPSIHFPGCGAPLVAPLASGVRVNGESAGASFAARVCSPNEPGV